MLSAINGDSNSIFPGAAISIKSDKAFLALGTMLLPVAIAVDGAISKQVVAYTTSGVIELQDWTLATGGKFLVSGKAYFSSGGGKISVTGAGLAVGVAISQTQLSVQIASPSSPAYSMVVIGSAPAPVATPTQTVSREDIIILAGIGSPTDASIPSGDYWLDNNSKKIWGPKSSGWGSPALWVMGPITVNNLPTGSIYLGCVAFASNGRKPGESSGHGTGVHAGYDGTKWYSFLDGNAVAS